MAPSVTLLASLLSIVTFRAMLHVQRGAFAVLFRCGVDRAELIFGPFGGGTLEKKDSNLCMFKGKIVDAPVFRSAIAPRPIAWPIFRSMSELVLPSQWNQSRCLTPQR